MWTSEGMGDVMMSVLKQLMMPIRRWWLGVVMVLGVAGVVSILPACSFLSSPKTIYVNQTILQSATNKKWDEIAKVMKDNGLTAEQPVIMLMPDKQRVGAKFMASVDLGLMGLKLNGDMQMSGTPEYNSQLQAIVLKNFAVDSFNVKNLPAMADGLARRVIERMIGQKMGADVPIYFLKSDQLSFAGKEWLPEKIVVEQERLSITLQPHDKP